jgi:hypothetical protein
MKHDPYLAVNWRASKIRSCLRRKDKNSLVQFLRERHHERFFQPIRNLKSAPDTMQGYGFAMMALCSLLVETIQSYRDGLPTTYGRDLTRLQNLLRIPAAYRLPATLRINGKKTFRRFFRKYNDHFDGLSGVRFYKNIRNGLLHQAQTKAGWTLWKQGPRVWDPKQKRIFRDNFAEGLEASFESYLNELRMRPWNSKLWTNAARKIWWLIRLSL